LSLAFVTTAIEARRVGRNGLSADDFGIRESTSKSMRGFSFDSNLSDSERGGCMNEAQPQISGGAIA
jgi:hypothetical protein